MYPQHCSDGEYGADSMLFKSTRLHKYRARMLVIPFVHNGLPTFHWTYRSSHPHDGKYFGVRSSQKAGPKSKTGHHRADLARGKTMKVEQRRGCMDHPVEKLLYSRRDTAEALSLSIRSIDYLVTTGRLSARRVGGKILIPASAIRRFAREDHPDSVRSVIPRAPDHAMTGQDSQAALTGRFQPQSERPDDTKPLAMNGSE
jgi:hypothetical protein